VFVSEKNARGVLTAVKYHNILPACQEILGNIEARDVARRTSCVRCRQANMYRGA
jgi:hypothetical protein